VVSEEERRGTEGCVAPTLVRWRGLGWGTHIVAGIEVPSTSLRMTDEKQIPRFARDDKRLRGKGTKNMNLEIEAMALVMPEVAGHPNRLPFHGVLTLVGVASQRPPSGARGHRVMLTRKASETALPSLLGMALDYAPALDSHDARRKIGIITEAEIVPMKAEAKSDVRQELKPISEQVATARLKPWPFKAASEMASSPDAALQIAISGYLYAHDFSDVVDELRAGHGSLGMSYEIADAYVVSPASPVWTVTAFTFTGAAVLRREKTAYPETWFAIKQAEATRGATASLAT
jgi:hypothetical protein